MIFNGVKKISASFGILLAIILVGIFLRTYNFHDFLRFNADQSRDAAVINNALEGKEALPLLGPKAGGTDFRLGPAFYYFNYASGLVFGGNPDKLAYPDLLFSILAIPLFYVFSRRYFGKNISLAVAFLFAISLFTVRYSRFSWNPNSTPFFTMLFLYALLKISDNDSRNRYAWPVVAGAALGIGVQLHSLFLFTIPPLAILFFAFLFFKKNPAWKKIGYIAIIALVFNIPQVISEKKTGMMNTRAFIVGTNTKSGRGKSLAENIALDAACHIQSNAFSVFSLREDGNCLVAKDVKSFFKNSAKKNLKNIPAISTALISIVFSLIGYFLLARYFRKETDSRKRIFLGLIIGLAFIYFLILVPLAEEISMRFFLTVEFIPFLILGFILKFINDKLPKKGVWLSAVIIIFAAGMNAASLKKDFSAKAGHDPVSGGIPDELTLFEMEAVARFIKENSNEEKIGYVEGKNNELFKYFRSLDYLSKIEGIDLIDIDEIVDVPKNDNIYTLKFLKKSERDAGKPIEFSGYGIEKQADFARVTIYKLNKR
ncbi:MAG: hypothetical protein A2288_02085 [Candidatus Moranbacteria bacterium RIFOXYA12_FULL_44_15]|nr:MAG: hypothetical protein A2288_02085 [Candidatus Moranbacteria bacterium RIFOXYA12_FULL_44_15]